MSYYICMYVCMYDGWVVLGIRLYIKKYNVNIYSYDRKKLS